MDRVETLLQQAAAWVSRQLDPMAEGLNRLDHAIRQQLDAAGIAPPWHWYIIAAIWVLLLGMVLRTLSGVWRLLAIVLVLLAWSKMYGLLPGG